MDKEFRRGNLGEKLENYYKDIGRSREVIRSSLYKIVLLSSAITGFSVTLFSTQFFQSKLNVDILRFSWYSFLLAIICGIAALFLEGRLEYVISERSYDYYYAGNYQYSFLDKCLAHLAFIIVIFYPYTDFFLERKHSGSEREKKISNLVIHYFYVERRSIGLLENLTIISFIAGLVLLTLSF